MPPKLDSLTRDQLIEEVRGLRQSVTRLTDHLAALGPCETVCEALLTHVKHGGSIPWPTVRKPFEQWREAEQR